jgi:anhydro-N-acetylmuramic acid kinase
MVAVEGIWLGLMSGTSVDAIDVVALGPSATQPHAGSLLGHRQAPWPTKLQRRLQALPCAPPRSWAEYLELDVAIAQAHVQATRDFLNSHRLPEQPRAVGFHGQTIFHAPAEGNTLQLGSGAHLAAGLGLPVVADLRRADMAQGGQGAPLASAFHHALWGMDAEDTAVLNLGGIANLSILRNGKLCAGFDTGPANGLMDSWVQQHWQQPFDCDGNLARQGRVLPELLHAWLQDPYFQLPAPKSTGREYFHLAWAGLDHGHQADPADVLRTLLELSVKSISDALAPWPVRRVILVGGGSRNNLLVEQLRLHNPTLDWRHSADWGWPYDTIEAGTMAWLAMRHCAGVPGNAISVTGADRATILGAYYPAAV